MKIKINGKVYEAKEGESLLDLATRNNIHIPTLCYDGRFEPKTSCFLCVVEDKKNSKLIPSCSSFVSDGMEIETDNSLVKEARKTALELLLSEHDASCFSPCKTSCPSNIDARDYVLYTSKKEEFKGFNIIRRKNPLVAVLGRVCPAFCEKKCNRGKVDETVAIRLLKKQIADVTYNEHYEDLLDYEKSLQKELKSKQDKNLDIAIVGGGPAGLSASYYLALNGHNVTIYDDNKKLGGMLRYSIPAYRLPRAELDREIESILNLGIKTELGKKLSVNDISILAESYDFVVVAVGTWQDTKIVNVGDFKDNDIESALSYLKRMAIGEKTASGKGQRVLVIGGGNTAFDSARTALRRGAKEVIIAYRRSILAMPAEKIEIHEALEEGVKIIELISPKTIETKDNKFTMLFSKMEEIDELDSRGRKKIRDLGQVEEIDFDKLIYAAGQYADTEFLSAIQKTNKKNVLLAGDFRNGASTVIEAVASGRKTAEFILGIKKDEMSFYSSRKSGVLPPRKLPDKKPQIRPEYLEVNKRIEGDVVYELPYKDHLAQEEAKRCLNCGCASVENCDLRLYSMEYEVDANKYKLKLPHRPVRTVDAQFSPYIIHDNAKCIKCGKCIDVCKYVSGQDVLSFINRGYDVIVSSTPEDKIFDCTSCGACLDVCPTGAFSEKLKSFPYMGTSVESATCKACAMHCELQLHYSRDKELMFIRGNGGELCKHIRWKDTRIAPQQTTIDIISMYKDRLLRSLDLSKYDMVFSYQYCSKGDNPALFYALKDFREQDKLKYIETKQDIGEVGFNDALLIVSALKKHDNDLKDILDTHSVDILLLYENLLGFI